MKYSKVDYSHEAHLLACRGAGIKLHSIHTRTVTWKVCGCKKCQDYTVYMIERILGLRARSAPDHKSTANVHPI